jgi:penicillin-binding protein
MYSAFCNNGDMIKPTLVKKLMRQDGIKYETVEEVQPSVLAKSVFKQSTLDILLPLLEEVVKSPEGTGHPVNMQGVRIAGKTGTAELGQDKSREISWFAGFWLDQTEKRLVIVMVDVPEGEGKLSKFDIAKALLTPAPQENNPAENTSPANTGPAQ